MKLRLLEDIFIGTFIFVGIPALWLGTSGYFGKPHYHMKNKIISELKPAVVLKSEEKVPQTYYKKLLNYPSPFTTNGVPTANYCLQSDDFHAKR